MFGRATEIAALAHAVDAFTAGVPQVIEICGGRGSGRSTLVSHAVQTARQAGFVALTAFGDLDGHADIATQLTAQLDGTRPADFARTTPLVIAVDDADRCGRESKEWLAALAGQAHTMIVVATARQTLGSASVLPIGGLPEEAVAELAAAAFGAPVDPGFAAEIVRRTLGWPVVVRAVLDLCVAEGVRDPAMIAELSAGVIEDRVARGISMLPAEVADLLRVIAVCGAAFDFTLVGALAGMKDWTPARALDLLVTSRMVVTDADGAVHLPPWVPAERVLESTTQDARRDLHARAARLGHQAAVDEPEVARILAATPPLGEPWVVPLLSTAAQREIERGTPCQAARHLERALREPLGPVAKAEVVVRLAVIESSHVPEVGDRRLARMLLEEQPAGCTAQRFAAADLLFARGDATLARRTFGALPPAAAERAATTALYWLADDAPLEVPELGLLDVPEPSMHPGDAERAGPAAWLSAGRGEDLELTRSLARTALTGPAPMLMSRMYACGALLVTDDLLEADAGLSQALAEARGRGLAAVSSRVLTMRSTVRELQGRIDEAADDVERAIAELPLVNWHPDARPVLVARDVLVCLARGRIDLAETAAARLPEDELGLGHGRTLFLFARGALALASGDARTAVTSLEECGRRMRARHALNPAVLPWRALAAAGWRELGEPARAEVLAAEEATLARRWGSPSTLARVHLSRGGEENLREAVRLLQDAPHRLLRATALLDLAQIVERHAAEPLVREAAKIAVMCRSSPLITRARGLGWVPGE